VKSTARRRYSLAVSVGYVFVGIVIAVRSVVSDVIPLAVLGLVFVALGAVRIREYLIWRRTFSDR
jgi:hypothetical protein